MKEEPSAEPHLPAGLFLAAENPEGRAQSDELNKAVTGKTKHSASKWQAQRTPSQGAPAPPVSGGAASSAAAAATTSPRGSRWRTRYGGEPATETAAPAGDEEEPPPPPPHPILPQLHLTRDSEGVVEGYNPEPASDLRLPEPGGMYISQRPRALGRPDEVHIPCRCQILALGLYNCEMTDRHSPPPGEKRLFNVLPKKRAQRIDIDEGSYPVNELQHVVSEGYGLYGLFVLVETRMFHDPDQGEARDYKHHTGHHPRIMLGVIHDPSFEPWLSKLVSDFYFAVTDFEWKSLITRGIVRSGNPEERSQQEAWRTDDPGLIADRFPINLIVMCRSGRHRSVAVSCIVRHVFQTAGWLCEVDYASEGKQWTHTTCSGGCPICRWEAQDDYTRLDDDLFLVCGMWYNRWRAVCEDQRRNDLVNLFEQCNPELITQPGNYIHLRSQPQRSPRADEDADPADPKSGRLYTVPLARKMLAKYGKAVQYLSGEPEFPRPMRDPHDRDEALHWEEELRNAQQRRSRIRQRARIFDQDLPGICKWLKRRDAHAHGLLAEPPRYEKPKVTAKAPPATLRPAAAVRAASSGARSSGGGGEPRPRAGTAAARRASVPPGQRSRQTGPAAAAAAADAGEDEPMGPPRLYEKQRRGRQGQPTYSVLQRDDSQRSEAERTTREHARGNTPPADRGDTGRSVLTLRPDLPRDFEAPPIRYVLPGTPYGDSIVEGPSGLTAYEMYHLASTFNTDAIDANQYDRYCVGHSYKFTTWEGTVPEIQGRARLNVKYCPGETFIRFPPECVHWVKSTYIEYSDDVGTWHQIEDRIPLYMGQGLDRTKISRCAIWIQPPIAPEDLVRSARAGEELADLAYEPPNWVPADSHKGGKGGKAPSDPNKGGKGSAKGGKPSGSGKTRALSPYSEGWKGAPRSWRQGKPDQAAKGGGRPKGKGEPDPAAWLCTVDLRTQTTKQMTPKETIAFSDASYAVSVLDRAISRSL